MKKMTSLVLALVMCFAMTSLAFAYPKSPNANAAADSTVYVVDEETRNNDIQRQLNEFLAAVIPQDDVLRGEYDYDYSYVTFAAKYVTRSGYIGGQPAGGVKFAKPGGTIYWKPEGGPKLNATVSFAVPFELVTLAVDLGMQSSGGTAYGQRVDNYTDYVKLWVNKTMEVVPTVVYRTHRVTGVKEVYSTSIATTMYDFAFEVHIV